MEDVLLVKNKPRKLRVAQECPLNADSIKVDHVYRIVGVFHEWDGHTWQPAGGTVAARFKGPAAQSVYRLYFESTDGTVWMLTDPAILLGMQTARVYHLSGPPKQFSR